MFLILFTCFSIKFVPLLFYHYIISYKIQITKAPSIKMLEHTYTSKLILYDIVIPTFLLHPFQFVIIKMIAAANTTVRIKNKNIKYKSPNMLAAISAVARICISPSNNDRISGIKNFEFQFCVSIILGFSV